MPLRLVDMPSPSGARLVFCAAIVATSALVGVGSAYASPRPQVQTGSIRGRVSDLNGVPLAGIQVTASGPGLPEQRTTTTDPEGRYRFILLPPGAYSIRFTLGDVVLLRDAVATIGDDLVVDASMAMIQIGVEVAAGEIATPDPPPGIDVQGAWVGANFDQPSLQELPDARDIWSVLANRAPAVVTSTFNVGGSESGLQPDVSARGASSTQTSYWADGVAFTDPDAIGAAGFYYDFDAIADLQVSTAAHAVEVQAPGVNVNLVTRSGGNELHGSGQFYWTDGSWQSDNLSDEQRQQGLTQGTSIDQIADTSVQLGGPLVRDRATLFTSARYYDVDRLVPGFPEVDSTTFPSWLLKGNVHIDERNRVWGSYTTQWYDKPNRDASALVTPEATLVEDARTSILQGSWQGDVGAETLLDARFSLLSLDLPLRFRDDVTGQSTFDFVSGVTSGAAPFSAQFDRRRVAVNVLLKHYVPEARGSHDLTFGFSFDNSTVDSSFEVIDDVGLFTFFGLPDTVVLYNTPLAVENDVNVTSLFGQDAWTSGNLTLGLGLRVDLTSGWLPEQQSPAGSFAPARSFTRVDDVIGWSAVVPRLNAVYDVRGDGRLALEASFSMYSDQLAASTVSFANPNAQSFAVHQWNDLNGDLQYQLGEEGDLLALGGALVGQIDPDFNTPLTRELTVGVEHEFAPGWVAGATFIYRHQDDIQEDINIGLSDSDFEPVEVPDPAGGTLTVFNQVSGFGEDLYELTNVGDKEVTYKGVDLTLERRYRDGWQLHAALTLSDARQLGGKTGFVPGDPGGVSDLYDNPNAQINAIGASPWDRPYILKASGTYTAPWQIILAGVLRSESGAPLARILPVELNQGVVDVFADPRGYDRLPSITTFDFRVGKDFLLSGDAAVSVYLDVFNFTNASATTQAIESEPFVGMPLATLAPRTLRLGARVAF